MKHHLCGLQCGEFDDSCLNSDDEMVKCMGNDEHAQDSCTTCDPHSAQDTPAAPEVIKIMHNRQNHYLHQLTLLYVS